MSPVAGKESRMNAYWQSIAKFWRDRQDVIMSGPANEWVIGVYEWDGLIRLTPIEEWLWGDIRDLNAVFYPQWPVGGFFVDFANPKTKVALECDGAQWHTDWRKDAARDAKLSEMGWDVYRFTGKECRREHTEEDYESGAWRERPMLASEYLQAICHQHALIRTKESIRQWGEKLFDGVA